MSNKAAVAVRIAMKCPECLGPVPLNRVSSVGFCHHCQSTLDLEAVWPTSLFSRIWTEAPATWSVGKRDFNSNVSLPLAVDVERVAEPPAGATARLPDSLVRRVFPRAVCIYGESAGGDPASQALDKPLLFACLECGAKLAVDGTKRVVTCDHCTGANYLSDAMWLRMHPALKRQWFVLEYDAS
jgi:Zn finger protein HypA/HybF involved in hydrogenase expression